jgi:membrane associated rhomboid family serine protease
VWLLDLARRGLERRLPWGEQLGRSAYGAFMLQTVFLLGLAVALRPAAAPAEVKALVVALGAVTGSFGAAWLLVSRAPGVARIL